MSFRRCAGTFRSLRVSTSYAPVGQQRAAERARLRPRGRGDVVKLKETRIGTKVRVLKGHGMPDLEGCTATIARRFILHNCRAFEVRFEDGYPGLFWHHELEEIEKEDTSSRSWQSKSRGSTESSCIFSPRLVRQSHKKKDSHCGTKTYIALLRRIFPLHRYR
jgi:hypothetical protein